MKGNKPGSGVWQYLQESGILDHGTHEEIEAARVSYWKAYKRRWRQEHRSVFTITLTVDESKELRRTAKAHHATPTTFIRSALFAYIHSIYIAPDPESIQELRLLFAQTYFSLQTILDSRQIGEQLGDNLLARMDHLEETVLTKLLNPPSLEKYVIDTIAQNPSCKDRLLHLLQTL